MAVITLPDGRSFVPQEWHDVEIRIIPRHNEALVTCRACGAMKLMEETSIRTDATSGMKISQATSKLRCSSCGAKDADLQFGYIGGDPPEY